MVKLHGYSIGHTYDDQTKTLTLKVRYIETDKIVHTLDRENTPPEMAYHYYIKYCDYLVKMEEYHFLLEINQLT